MKKLKSVIFVIMMTLTCATGSFAVTHYTRLSHGLVSNVVTTIEMDPSGSLWIGTDNGVTRFNGLEWKNLRSTNAGFPTEYINDIMPDFEGNIYFATTGGITVYDAPKWDNLSLALPSPDVESMIIDGLGDIWFGTGGGLAKYRNLKITETYKMSNSDIPNDFIKQVEIDSFAFFWLATGNGVSRFDGHNFVNYSSIQGQPITNIKSVSIENGPTDDILWIATDIGVGRMENNIWIWQTTFHGLLDNNVRYAKVDYQNNKWFATLDKGVSLLTNLGVWVDYTKLNGNLIDDRAMTVAVDNSDNIWIGTQGGMTKVGDNAIISFNKILYLNLEALAYVTVNDPLMNLDPNTAETLTVQVYSTTDPTGINLTLRETDIDTGIFSSNTPGEELTFNYTASDEAARSLLVTKGDEIFALYDEADVSAIRKATAYYNEEAPFEDKLFLDPPCFIATASYEESSYFDGLKDLILRFLSADK